MGLLLLLLLLLPSSSAQSETRPAPPERAVLEVYRVEQWDPDSTSYQAWWNLTFQLSSNDPDQVNGALDYNLWFNGTRILSAISLQAVPGREGWVYFNNDFAASAGDSGVYSLALTANNTTAEESILSCSLSATFRSNNSYTQCGATISAPPGVSAITTREANETAGAIVQVRWKLSEDDVDQVSGAFDYWLYVGSALGSMYNQTITPSLDEAGVLVAEVEYFTAPGASFTNYNKVMARDPLTHQRSDFSCTVFVQAGALYERQACGTLGAPGGGPVAGEPSFPMVDLDGTSAASGISVGILGAMLGVAFVFGLATMGFLMGGIIAGGAATALGIVFLGVTGIMPLWVLILIFLVAVTVIVLFFRSGSS